MPSDACVEELETLCAIFLDEIVINDSLPDGGAHVSMMLFPATADDEESRYVTLTLEIALCNSYPKVLPKITFRNPRGLNDIMLDDLLKSMNDRCVDRLQSQMIYEIIDMGKEFLTKNNRPASECPICLLSFTEFDVFFRTHCFHHFHSHCLGNYLHNLATSSKETDNMPAKEKPELTCPVCRENFGDDIDVNKLVSAPPPSEEFEPTGSDSTIILQDWKDKRQSMKQLFEKQKSQGGIIDLNEKNKKPLVISSNREAAPDSDSRPTRSETTGSVSNIVMGAGAVSQRQGHGDVGSHPHPHSHTTGRPRNNGRGQHQFHNSQHSSNRHQVVHNNSNQSFPTGSNNRENCQSGPESKSTTAACSDRGGSNGHYRKVRGGGSYNRRRNK